MSDIIKLLPDSVANQIAAGEVVQRPASVVKELLENSVDAKASKIQILLKDAGRASIQIIDDGIGMSATDSRMSFERHATSKIKNTEDIFNIKTKGFRGEALASIAAVSQVEMKTKLESDELGQLIKIEGSEIKEQQLVSTIKGTAISIKNLFYNVPARRNFLKNNQVELKHIIDEFYRVSLAHPEIAMSLEHNNNEIFNLQKGSFRQRIVSVFGQKFNDKLVPVKEETGIVSIEGFIGKPEFSKKKRGEQFFFVNDRFIKSQYLNFAIIEGFSNLIPQGHYPSYFIKLEIDPKHIDINIHPTKTEIKFDDEHTIFAIIKSVVKHSLGQYNIAPSLDFDLNPDLNVPLIKKKSILTEPKIQVNRDYNPFKEERETTFIQKESSLNFYKSFREEEAYQELEKTQELSLENDENSNEVIQVHQKYLIYQVKSGIIIIDQYRAHQRVLFEFYLNKLTKHNSLSQQLMFPIIMQLTPVEKDKIYEIEELLFQLGFDFEFKDFELIIKALPVSIEQNQANNIIEDCLRDDNNYKLKKEEKIALSIARSTAIKKGHKLSKEEMKKLINDLFKTDNSNYSPEGKSIFVNLPIEYIKQKLS